MHSKHPVACRISQTPFRLAFMLFTMAGCLKPEFTDFRESTDQTYDQYLASYPHARFPQKGASAISSRTFSTRDGYDTWWRFIISESDFLSTVQKVARNNNGPATVPFHASAEYPQSWKPDAEVPAWWIINGGSHLQCIHWCFKAGEAERHHGWYLVYNPDSTTAWCWHWNHQWSSDQCP